MPQGEEWRRHRMISAATVGEAGHPNFFPALTFEGGHYGGRRGPGRSSTRAIFSPHIGGALQDALCPPCPPGQTRVHSGDEQHGGGGGGRAFGGQSARSLGGQAVTADNVQKMMSLTGQGNAPVEASESYRDSLVRLRASMGGGGFKRSNEDIMEGDNPRMRKRPRR